MAESFILTCSTEKIPEAVDFIKEALKKRKLASKEITKTLLTSEEVLTKLVSNAPDSGTALKISVGGILGKIEISFKAKGAPFEVADIERELLFEQDDEEANSALRKLINRILGDNLQIKNSNGVNSVMVTVKKSRYAGLVYTILALLLGILTGLLLKNVCPPEVSKGMSTYLFTPVYTVFMNTLKFIVGPLVFFSIASSIADFSSSVSAELLIVSDRSEERPSSWDLA